MTNNKPSILVLTSLDPHMGSGVVAENHYRAFKQAGYEVDFMSPYPVKGNPNYLYIYKNKRQKTKTYTHILRRITDNNRFVNKFRHRKPSFYFFYRRETNPPMSINDIVNAITKKYDIVYVVFWQGMLTFKTINAIYDKIHCLFFFCCIDYSPMSGGCHFTRDCNNFEIGCGFCKAIGSHKLNDFTRFNVKYRENVYNKIKPVVMGNEYMHTFFNRSYLLKNYKRKLKTYFMLDLNEFYEHDRNIEKEKYGILPNKKFVIFFGSVMLNEIRKGFRYLLEALKQFYNKLNKTEREEILLLIAGRNIEEIKDMLYFDYKYLGYVNAEELPALYSLSDIFLSSSIDDAGPSMVNQSLACGTPVVSFEMGTALDYVKGRNTGYCAKLQDSRDFACGIEKIYRMPKDEYIEMRKECRKVSEELSSASNLIGQIQNAYDKFGTKNSIV